MRNNVEKFLLKLESKCSLEVNIPASLDALCELKQMYPVLPRAVLDMYALSDGIEINVPGTTFYPVNKLLSINKDATEVEYVKIGYMVFGDEIVVGKDGRIYQIDHETGTEFLDWETFEDFLEDELAALD
ncbi:MAG: SMI1/KNR4 family protein [Lachnospiraceae bacterium]|nr:SMI1/KNR4 family protein [Lachnospiraceae bacterium]